MSRIALVYIRQSRHKDYERTASPEVQEAEVRRLPAVAACEEVEVFADLDVSGGKTKGRAALGRLLARLDAGRVDVVAAYDQSRAFRNTRDALEFYALMEKRPAVEVVFVHGRFDRSPAGEFTYTAMAAAHAMERRMTAEKVRAAYAYRAAQGEATGQPPYGYRRAGDGRLEVDEETAEVVRRIFADYVTGTWSSKALARRLNDEGVPRLSPRSRFGWLPDAVVDILRNIAYTGRTYTGSRVPRRRAGDLVPASWPPIVEVAVFDRAQAILDDRRVSRAPRGLPATFGRLLVCSRCGDTMRVNRGKGGVYYRCRRDIARDAQCSAPAVSEARLAVWAEVLIRRLEALRPADWDEAYARAGERRKTPAVSAEAVSGALGRLGELFQWGHVTREHYEAERARLEGVRADLEARAARPTGKVSVDGIAALWQKGTASERRELLGTLFERLYVVDGRAVKFVARLEYREEIEELVKAAIGPGQEEPLVLQVVGAAGVRVREGRGLFPSANTLGPFEPAAG